MTRSSSREMDGVLEIALGDVRLTLLPDRATWWPEDRTVFIADPHFGKEATFRAAGLPIPDATTDDLLRLDRLLSMTSACRLIVLGDLIHNRQGVTEQLTHQVAQWRVTHPRLKVDLVRGNHDLASGDPPALWNIIVHESPLTLGPLRLSHHPDWQSRSPSLAGHLHPKYNLSDRIDELRLPCFLQRKQTLVLPAFGTFVDGDLIRDETDRVFVIAEKDVIEVPLSPTDG